MSVIISMKHKLVQIFLIPMVLMCFTTLHADVPYHACGGYGTQTRGGISGQIVKVTQLGSDGPGSLRAACEMEGERLVVFEVGGVIDLEKQPIKISNPYLTIAGQTAPHPGITLIRGGIQVNSHDVVIQHIASRPGEAGEAKGSGWEADGMAAYGVNAYNVVFDHCSTTWSTDENLSVSGPPDSEPGESSHDVTLYRCLVAEALSHSTHSEGEHSKGTLLLDGVSNVSIIGCLYAHNKRRHPLMKGNTRAVIVNNLFYDPGSQCIGMTDQGRSEFIGKPKAAIVGNVWMPGPSTTTKLFVKSGQERVCGDAYFRDNLLKADPDVTLTLADIFIKQLKNPPFWPDSLTAQPVSGVIPDVLRRAGARPGMRDPIDTRIVQSVIDGTGKILDSEQEVGGYPVYEATHRTVDVPSGESERIAWLDNLSEALAVDSTLDLSPLQLGVSGHHDKETTDPSDECLLRNYPNPFNPCTVVWFVIPEAADVQVTVYNLIGQRMKTLVHKNMSEGSHYVQWDGTNMSGQKAMSGQYYCKLVAGEMSETITMQLVK